MNEYIISRDTARLIAVGLYRDIGKFIEAADKEDYAKFKAEYEKTKAAKKPSAKKAV